MFNLLPALDSINPETLRKQIAEDAAREVHICANCGQDTTAGAAFCSVKCCTDFWEYHRVRETKP